LPEAGWCLPYGVVLHATDDGIVVESEKVHRVRLRDPHLERRLVEALAGGRDVGGLAMEVGEPALTRAIEQLRDVGALVRLRRTITIVDRLSLGIDARAAHVLRAETPEAIADCELAIIVGARDDTRLGECLERCDALQIPALVVWTSPGEVVAVVDDPSTAPCARCALSLDGRAVALSVTFSSGKVASAASDHARVERTFAAAVAERYAAPNATLEPGTASVWDVRDGSAALRAFPRHPGCSCAKRTRRKPSAPVATGWCDLRIARFTPVVPLGDAAGVARVAYRGAREPWPVSQDAFGIAIAAGPDARERAIGEAIERFAMLHAPADVRARSRRDLDAPVVANDAIASLLYRDDEHSLPGFRFPAFADDLALDWSWAVRASSNERMLVPTSLVGRPPRGGTRLVDGTSNGYACHPSEEQAKLRALLEVVERDALLLRWYTEQGLTRIDDVAAPSNVVLLLATVDIDLPVVVAATCLPEGSLRIGSAAATSFDVAVARAMSELEGQLAGPPAIAAPADLSHVNRGYGPRDHVAYYTGQAGRPVLERWRTGEKATTASELRARWPAHEDDASLVRSLEAVACAGLDVLFVDRSLHELFGDAWHVTRALIPGAVEMSWGMAYRRLASPRIKQALASGARLSSCPHPYA
jgi:ribosomal protein S12 methylthiotransferase accessory factor